MSAYPSRKRFTGSTVVNVEALASTAQRRELKRLDALLPREKAYAIYEEITGCDFFARTVDNRFKVTRGEASRLIDAYKAAR